MSRQSSPQPKIRAEFIEPMECALVSKLAEGPQWTFEAKLDGYRAIGVRTSRESILYSRNRKKKGLRGLLETAHKTILTFVNGKL